MNNECPECGTTYAMAPKDVGRRIQCKKCSTTLVIEADGFHREEAEPPSQDSSSGDIQSVTTHEKTKRIPVDSDLVRNFIHDYVDVPTILFGIGAAFVLIFAFMPLIGSARVDRRQSALEEAQFDHNKEIRLLREKPGNEEKVKAAEEKWAKTRQELQDDVMLSRFYNQQTVYRERYGTLFGFLLTMIGSLGLMRSDSGVVKRIFGAVVLAMEMLLVFSMMMGTGCGGISRPPISG